MSSVITVKTFAAVGNWAFKHVDGQTLAALGVKDAADGGLRTYMESKRGGKNAKVAAKERFAEEFLTLPVWILGKPAINKFILNPVMKWMNLDPHVDTQLVYRVWQAQRQGAAITQTVIPFIKGNASKYLMANFARLAIGVALPGAVIGFGIPPLINQMTRSYKARLKEVAGWPVKPVVRQQQAWNINTKDSYSNTINPYFAAPAAIQTVAPQSIRFGFAGNLLGPLAKVANDPFWGNVFVDGEISTGRLLHARNKWDFLEKFLREGSIILFLYKLGDVIAQASKRWFDEKNHTITDLKVDSLQWLKTHKVHSEAWQKDLALLKSLRPETGFAKISTALNPATGRFDNNPLLELARHQNWLKTLSNQKKLVNSQESKELFGKLSGSKTAHFILDSRHYLDVEVLQKDLGPLGERVIKMAKKHGSAELWRQFANRTYGFKILSVGIGMATSIGGISILTPLLAHWITRKYSGQDDYLATLAAEKGDQKPFQKAMNLLTYSTSAMPLRMGSTGFQR